MINKKFILDACCGGKCFWFNKKHPNTIYIDKRRRPTGHTKDRIRHKISPDKLMDFRKLEFEDKSFKLVVFDPLHLISKEESCIIARKYGSLNKNTWKEDIKDGFDECWRVLEDYGVLIFKWSEISIKRREILQVIDREPLFGTPILSRTPIHWFCFMKIPTKNETKQTKLTSSLV